MATGLYGEYQRNEFLYTQIKDLSEGVFEAANALVDKASDWINERLLPALASIGIAGSTQRSLARMADAITDPALRAQAQGMASGAIAPAEFLRTVERSPAGMRGFDRYLRRLASFTPADLERIAAQRDRQIGRIADELTTPPTGRHAQTNQSAHITRTHAADEDGPTWEDQTSWLE